MAYTYPSVSFHRNVVSSGKSWHNRLERRLDKEDKFSEAEIRNVLRPLRIPRANLVGPNEFKRVLRLVEDKRAYTKPKLDALIKFVGEAWPETAFEEIPVFDAPIRLHNHSRVKDHKVLSMAENPNVQLERIIGQNAIRYYFGLEPEVVDTAWDPQTYGGSVLLARAHTPRENYVVESLAEILQAEALIPASIGLSDIRYSVGRKEAVRF